MCVRPKRAKPYNTTTILLRTIVRRLDSQQYCHDGTSGCGRRVGIIDVQETLKRGITYGRILWQRNHMLPTRVFKISSWKCIALLVRTDAGSRGALKVHPSLQAVAWFHWFGQVWLVTLTKRSSNSLACNPESQVVHQKATATHRNYSKHLSPWL
jgi:hypothetical protein